MPQATGPIKAITQRDFSGGMNSVTDPYLISDKQCAQIFNLILDEHGALTTRDGYTVATVGPGGSPVVYITVLNKVDGTSIPLAIEYNVGTTVNSLYRTDTTPWTLIGTMGATGFRIPTSVTMTDNQVFAVGYTTPYHYDGTALTQITAGGGQTVPPGAKHLAFHLGNLWVWNTNPTTTTLDGPSSLRMSDPDDFNSWPNIAQTFISKDDGEVGMGLASFTIAETGISPTQTLIAFKNRSTYQVTGVLGLDLSGIPLFSVQKVKSDMGCIAPRTIQFVSGYGLIRLTHKGFALFDGVNDKLISEEVRPFIFGHTGVSGTNVTPINFDTVDLSYAGQSSNPPLYIAACPVEGTSLTRWFVYDLVRRAWTICTFPFNLTTLGQNVTPTTQPILQGGTDSSGPTPSSIVDLFTGELLDNGNAIPWSFRTRTFFEGSFLRPTYWRRISLDVEFSSLEFIGGSKWGSSIWGSFLWGAAPTPAPTNATVLVTITLQGLSPPISKTLIFPGSPSLSVWGQAVWGAFPWGGVLFNASQQSVGILRTATNALADISGSGHVVIRGLEWQVHQKPLTRLHR